MKKKPNTHICKEHLLAALSALPDDNRMFPVKALIRKAMNEVEHVETKRIRHAGTQEQLRIEDEWKKNLATKAAASSNPMQALDQISKMIASEQKKLEPKQVSTSVDTLLG